MHNEEIADELTEACSQGNVREEVIITELNPWLDTKQGLIIIHLNIRSIWKNWDQFKIIINKCIGKFDVLVLSEISKIRVEEEYYNLDGYNVFFNVRKGGKSGGGVAVYVQEKWTFNVDRYVDENSYEGIFGTLKEANDTINNVNYKLWAIYRAPHCKKKDFLSKLEYELEKNINDNVILIGDINIDISRCEDQYVDEYKSILSANGFTQCISNFTREEHRLESLSQTCIDHIFVKNRYEPTLDVCILQTKLTDHYLIGVAIGHYNTRETLTDRSEFTLVKKIKEELLFKLLNDVKWQEALNSNECDQIYEYLDTNFHKCYEQATKLQLVKESQLNKSRDKGWLTQEILKLIKDRDRKFKMWKNCKNLLASVYRSDYEILRAQVTKTSRSNKRNYLRQKFEESKDLQSAWKTINEALGKKIKQSADEVIKKYIGKTDSLENITSSFANSFVNDVMSLIHNCDIITCPTSQNSSPAMQSMLIPQISEREVLQLISDLDNQKQPGIDNIRVIDLKNLGMKIVPIITKVINTSMRSSTLPLKLKTSIIKPVHKKGDYKNYNNYRPISILPVTEKLIERCVANRLYAYLETFKIINQRQFGFQKNKGTSDLLTKFSDYVNTNLNLNRHVIAIYIDFSKAFDTLNHNKLLTSLNNIGISGPLLRWFTNYLENRSIIVRINNVNSIKLNINSGVAQGSILAPVLYIIYVNSLFNHIENGEIFMYADDTVLLTSDNNLQAATNLMQANFKRLQEWTHDNDLVINASKTKAMHIKSPYNKDTNDEPILICHSYRCLHLKESDCKEDCVKIELVNTHKYLGLTIDNTFSWKFHIQNLCNRLRSCIYHMYNLKRIVPKQTLRTIYMAIVESILAYGILAWGNATYSHLRPLISIQNKIIKIITTSHNTINSPSTLADKYKSINLLPFQQLFKYRLILKYYYNEEFKSITKHTANTRLQSSHLYDIPHYNNKYGKRRLHFSIPSNFNIIPASKRNFVKYKDVKLNIKSWLIVNLQEL